MVASASGNIWCPGRGPMPLCGCRPVRPLARGRGHLGGTICVVAFSANIWPGPSIVKGVPGRGYAIRCQVRLNGLPPICGFEPRGSGPLDSVCFPTLFVRLPPKVAGCGKQSSWKCSMDTVPLRRARQCEPLWPMVAPRRVGWPARPIAFTALCACGSGRVSLRALEIFARRCRTGHPAA